jgi:hypothetical protein
MHQHLRDQNENKKYNSTKLLIYQQFLTRQHEVYN